MKARLHIISITLIFSNVALCQLDTADYHKLKLLYQKEKAIHESDSVDDGDHHNEKYHEAVRNSTAYYRVHGEPKYAIKGVNLSTDNDLIAFNNEDKNYTGAIRMEVITDYFRMKALSLRRDHRWLGYQTLFGGLEIYTPDSLKSCSINIPDSCLIDTNDRPFGSFHYVGRSKYIMNANGTIRSASEFKIGVIGGKLGEKFQSVLHRDVSQSAQKPTGWITQIANGGRLALQYDNEIGNLLISPNPNALLFTINCPLNLHWNYAYSLGHFLIGTSTGLGISNRDFFRKNQGDFIFVRNDRSFGSKNVLHQFKRTWFLELIGTVSVVGYNTMLEGYPVLDEDNAFNDVHTIPADEIDRVTGNVKLKIGFRLYNTTVIYTNVLQFREFEGGDPYHNWGRLSFLFKVDSFRDH